MSYEIREFACAQCGNCCRGDGYVRLSPDEVARAARHLGLAEPEFRDAYCRRPEIDAQAVLGDLWLIDKPGPEKECAMLDANRCRIHPVKPDQCVGFPLKWRTPDVMDYCEGMKS